MGMVGIITILNLAAQALRLGVSAAAVWTATRSVIDKAIDEGRDISQEEVAAMQQRLADRHQAIQAADPGTPPDAV